MKNMNMKLRMLFAAAFLAAVTTGSLQAAEMVRLRADTQGSKMRIEGTSNIHDWQVESKLIGGFMEVGQNFPMEPGQAVSPGKVEAKVEAFVPVRSLKSLEKDGKPYSDKMDEVMYEKFMVDKFQRVTFHLTDLALKEAAKSKETPYTYDATGELAVAGVTNKISLPVNVLPLGDKKFKISGTVAIKMTDYKIDPPAPKIALGMIKTGDDVKLLFDWSLKAAPAPAAAK
jgi:polyisoprenoid-binding protein YceI